MRVLITGGAGFIGSHLADRLLERGDEVLVIDNFATGRRDNLAPHPRLRVVEGTIADAELVERAFDEFKPERVVHAAASYKDPGNWAEDVRTNALGTALVVRAAERCGVERFVYLQTALCYGLNPGQEPLSLSQPLSPQDSSYAISKTTGEHYLGLSGLEFLSFRLANVYGPRNLSGPLPTFYQRLTGGKPCFVVDTRRDFIYVDDVVEVVLRGLAGMGRKGHYHIATGSDHAIADLFEATRQALGLSPEQPVELRARGADDAYTILLDPSQTEADFAWKAQTALEAGVSRAVAWYRRQGVSQTFTHLNLDLAVGKGPGRLFTGT